ncbi:MAG TPA: dihydropyrimidine dehydrogenase, partial [Nitrospirae bacterium]|nr:dihydropyrimidine dehydrogenase [Nitrospirota bacterium]
MDEKKEDKKPKKRINMREQEPLVRAGNFKEVPYAYSADEALEEASRCLSCKKPACRKGCPVEVNIPAFISLIKEGKLLEACHKIKERNALPAVCGRVCPQESQCESLCIVGKKGEPVAIGNLERFVAD